MSKALVMGASGFLGSHVVKALAAEGRGARIMVRASSDTRSIDHLQVERAIGDVSDGDSLAAVEVARGRFGLLPFLLLRLLVVATGRDVGLGGPWAASVHADRHRSFTRRLGVVDHRRSRGHFGHGEAGFPH